VIGALALAASRPAAQTPQELHEVPIIVTVDGEPRGEVAALVPPPPGTAVRVDAAALRSLLRRSLSAEAQAAIETRTGADGRIDVEQLRGAGLEAAYDAALVRLALGIPPELRAVGATELRSRIPPRAAGAIPSPSPVSGYVNFRGGVDYLHEAPATVAATGRQPARADLDMALHLYGNVVEGVLLYAGDGDPRWQRGDVRLVHDDPPRRVRTILGDFAAAPGGFQNSRAMAGLNIARNFSLQPYRATEPIGRTSYLLRRPSRVEVFVNERLVRTLQQAPGPHQVRDLPFASGTNDVRLRITDDVGNVEELVFPYFFDSQLLAVGEEEFSAAVGVPWRTELGRRVYDENAPTVSGFHRFGVSDTLTLGSNLQADPKQHLVGVEALWASRIGTLRLDLGASGTDEVGDGFSVRLQQRYIQVSGAARTLALAAQHTSRRFAALGSTAPDNPVAQSYSARYSQRLSAPLSVGVGATYDVARGERRDADSQNLSFGYRVARGVTASVSFDRIAQASGVVERRAFLSVYAALADLRQAMSVTRDSLADTNAIEWSYAPVQSVGAVAANASYNNGRSADTYLGTANYTGNRFTAGATHSVDDAHAGGVADTRRTNLRLGTALVYVDGYMALARPINNSFVLITRHPNLVGQAIGIDPIEDAYNVQSDWLGAPVLPDLQPYVRRNISIEAPGLPPGYDLGPTVYTLEPWYKSGTRITVGTDATVAVSGTLEDARGESVVLQAGEAHSLAQPQRPPVLLFTNRSGQFRADGFKPGEYELRMFYHSEARLRFAIPKDAAGAHELGTLRLPAAAPRIMSR
jgi:outer membrane usher protein